MASVKYDQERGAYSLDEAIKLTGHGCYNYQVLIACSVITHAVAMDMFGFNIVVAAATCDLQLGLAESGALASAPFAGVLFAYPWGYYADVQGRRRALLLSTSVGFIMAALSSFAPSWQVMLALKILGCAFSTASSSLTMTYLGECTGREYRDRYLFIMTAANLASEIVSFALAFLILPLDFNIALPWLSITFRPWRLFTLIMASTLGVGALLMYFLEESPKFLADRGDSDATVKSLRVIYEKNIGKKDDYPVKNIEVGPTDRRKEGFWRSVVKQTVPLFKPPLLWRTLQLFYLIIIVCGPSSVLVLWFSMIVNLFFKSLEGVDDNGSFCQRIVFNLTTTPVESSTCNDIISPNTLYSGIIMGLFYAVMTLVVSWVAAWRRLVLIFSFTVGAVNAVVLDLLTVPWAMMVAFLLMMGSVLGLGSVAAYSVDFFPTTYRGMAMSLGMMSGRLVALAGTNLIGIFIVNYCSLTFYSLAFFIADASEKAYGACVYVRSVATDGTVNVRLLASKSKIAPIKATTIPRLELCAALMGARLCAKIVSSVTFEHGAPVYWTDSMILLGWLSSSPSQLKPFVRHRVTEIQDTSNGWRYVPSKQNPADLVSRGLSPKVIGDTTLWWSGPSFLKYDQRHWPETPNQDNKVELPEVLNYHVEVNKKDDANFMTNLIEKTSSLSKLKRIVAFILRFVNNISKDKAKLCGFLSVSEINAATTKLLLVAQQESFPVERQLLTDGKPLPSKNRLLSLSPFLDSDNLIRVGGRLSNSYYDYNVKHPILICGKHRLSHLIFDSLHKTYMHAGPQFLLATARHNYWPLGGTRLAKRTVHSCVKCARFKAQTSQPIMGNLPSSRVHLEYPFLETGVDYAGPILIADRKGRGCKLIKSYICVFVCLATKALHLELVSDLTKEAFIAALNRFVARRGKPQNMFSDNGTTFVGTFNELSKLLKNPSLTSDLADQGIHFLFIPAYTPHFGGLWESAVKSVKYHLRRVLELTHLDFEEMATLLIQVEVILNSRPITPLSDDPSDFSFLSPAHFLIGRSLVALPHPQLVDRRIASLTRFQRIEALKQHFWERFHKEYVLWLQGKSRWRSSKGELKEGALVIVKDLAAPPLLWPLGRILRVLPGQDGIARVADIKTKKGIIRRAFNTICPLPTSY